MDKSYAQGMQAERDFQALCEKYKWRFEKATSQQDAGEHWDFRLWIRNKHHQNLTKGRYRIEVKAGKRLQRRCKEICWSHTWLESIGVPQSNGEINQGWLKGGRADYIAFQQEDSGFLFCKRTELVDKLQEIESKRLPFIYNGFDCENLDLDSLTHRGYKRKGPDGRLRQDLVFLVSIKELEALAGSFQLLGVQQCNPHQSK